MVGMSWQGNSCRKQFKTMNEAILAFVVHLSWNLPFRGPWITNVSMLGVGSVASHTIHRDDTEL